MGDSMRGCARCGIPPKLRREEGEIVVISCPACGLAVQGVGKESVIQRWDRLQEEVAKGMPPPANA